jgi:hypothetical protein
MAQLEPKIFTALSGNSAVAALVGTRIYPLILPQKCPLPAVTYQRISGGKVFSCSGYSGLEGSRIQVDCWAVDVRGGARGYPTVKALAAAVIAAMQAATTFRVSNVNDRDLFEDAQNIYRVSIDFSVWHREA